MDDGRALPQEVPQAGEGDGNVQHHRASLVLLAFRDRFAHPPHVEPLLAGLGRKASSTQPFSIMASMMAPIISSSGTLSDEADSSIMTAPPCRS